MVHHGHQHMLILGDTEKPRPQRNLGCQIKRVTRHVVDGLTQPAIRPAGGINDGPPEVGPFSRHHHLPRYPLARHHQRAQTLLATHHIAQRRTQRVGIQPPA